VRLGVIDVGSNTVHLLIVDAYPGARPWPAYSDKTELRLVEHLTDDGSVDPDGVDRLVAAVRRALVLSDEQGTEDLLAFATSALRDAANGLDVLDHVRAATGVDLEVLPGPDEARLTFLAVRRWFGWSSGRLLVLDIGGGSLEMASGIDEEPDVLESLPLGAGRLTRTMLDRDPPSRSELKALRKHVRGAISDRVEPFLAAGPSDHAVATSKTFRQLARIAGAAPSSEGAYVPRRLTREALGSWLPKLAEMSSGKRAQLPGVSPGRAGQLLAGAVVADTAMDVLDLSVLQLCPWALREGVILRRLDWMHGP
jgi:exopolyphosphatase / guanosine-5'-triphosphate,3'-diphosphate pyrophosphatase